MGAAGTNGAGMSSLAGGVGSTLASTQTNSAGAQGAQGISAQPTAATTQYTPSQQVYAQVRASALPQNEFATQTTQTNRVSRGLWSKSLAEQFHKHSTLEQDTLWRSRGCLPSLMTAGNINAGCEQEGLLPCLTAPNKSRECPKSRACSLFCNGFS